MMKLHSKSFRSLVENVTQMADSLETLRQKFEETIAGHDQVKKSYKAREAVTKSASIFLSFFLWLFMQTRVTINSQLADLQKTQEAKGEKNQELEIQLAVLKADFRYAEVDLASTHSQTRMHTHARALTHTNTHTNS